MSRLTCLSFLALALCWPLLAGEPAPAGQRVLYIYTWHDYFSPELIHDFEDKHNCQVEFDYYDSNETLFETLSSGGGNGYDIFTPPGNATPSLFRGGLIRRLDHALLPNLRNLEAKSTALSEDPGTTFCVPYTVTVTGIGYNKKLVPADALRSGWNIFADQRLVKRMAMLNDVREVFGAALKAQGKSINSVDRNEVEAAGRLVLTWKKNLAMFDVDQAKEGLQQGRLAAIQAYNGDIAELMADNPDIGFFVPAEGSAFNSDNFVISVDSSAVELAHAFINYFLNPEVAAKNMESVRYYMPNREAKKLLPGDFIATLAMDIPEAFKEKCEVVRDLGDDRALYDDVWARVLFKD